MARATGIAVVFAVILGSGVGGGVAVNGRAHHGPNNSGRRVGPQSSATAASLGITGPTVLLRQGWLPRDVGVGARLRGGVRAARRAGDSRPRRSSTKVRDGDRLAGLVWGDYVDRVARGMSLVVNTLDPDIFVIGGGMSNVDELYLDLPAALAQYTFSTVFETPIRKARHGNSSGVRGAAWLWSEDG